MPKNTSSSRRTRGRTLAAAENITYTAALRRLDAMKTHEHEISCVTPTMTRGMLPLFDPGARPYWKRAHGPALLTMQPAWSQAPDGRARPMGYPHGGIAMLILAWLSTRVARTQKREIDLGPTLADFVCGLGLPATLGAYSTTTVVRRQLQTLLECEVQIHGPERAWTRATPVSAFSVYWDGGGDQDRPWGSVRVSEHLFNEVMHEAVPIDLHVLRRLAQTPRAADAYLWIAGLLADGSMTVPWTAVTARLAATSTTRLNRHAPSASVVIREAITTVAAAMPRGVVQVRDTEIVVAGTHH
ncbi:replication protein RepA [Nocardia sp. NPDC051832]|uniref:replication protein RepA n=1 Tax=Nocardia sp. NPDC051832 TaxID=3155673 RepID=UPI00341C19EB